MLKKLSLVVALAIVLTTMPSAQDAKGVIAAASKAMGADSLRTIEYSGNGYDFVLGQAYNPSSAVAAIRQPKLQTSDRLPGPLVACRPRSDPGREPAARRGPAANPR
jgi:hypothetical protein